MALPSSSDKLVRIIMWSAPRTASTAITKCLAAIDGMEVWLEPYNHACTARDIYLKKCGGEWPTEYEGNEATFAKAAALMKGMGFPKIEPDRIV